jgi:hypothetical protein
MVAKRLIASLLCTAVLGCRDEGKQIVIVHLLQMRADAVETVAAGELQKGRAEAFEQAVIREVVASPDCGPILIARYGRVRDGDPLQDLMRRPHWDLSIGWVPNEERQNWLLAADGYRVLREGTGSAQEIGRAVCLQSRDAEARGDRVSALH